MRINLERGFRRITWVVSIAALAFGASLIGPEWWTNWVLWNHAGEHSARAVKVYLLGADRTITLPEGFPEDQIKDALDSGVLQKADDEEPRKENSHTRDDIDDIADRILARRPIAYIYQSPSGTTPSVLYSQKAILQAEAKGTLSPEVQVLLPKLRHLSSTFPQPLRNPFGEWVIVELLQLALFAASPWGVFFLVRWLVLGFKPD